MGKCKFRDEKEKEQRTMMRKKLEGFVMGKNELEGIGEYISCVLCDEKVRVGRKLCDETERVWRNL